jgi:hypothetical protein
MKKILSILLASSFLALSANAGGMIGVKVGSGSLDGERTVDPQHGVASSNTGSVSNEYAAIFAEFSVNDMVSVGLEVVPMEGQISTKDATSSDTTVTVSDLITAYALVSIGDSPFYGKVGYSTVDLAVDTNYTQNTVNSFDDSAQGPMIGLGAQFDSPIPFLDVVRVEGTYTDLGELSITTTDTNEDATTRKGEAELLTISLSLAKSF